LFDNNIILLVWFFAPYGGGAGSIANQALADNPRMDDIVWQHEIRQFRELMIKLGTQLQARGNEYPDMSSWLLAFSNWNQTGI
jgi:hypothetical protein